MWGCKPQKPAVDQLEDKLILTICFLKPIVCFSDVHPSINPPSSCNFLSIHPSCYTTIYMQACLLNHLSITSTWLPALSSFIHLHLANNLSSRPPTPKPYTNSNLLRICSSFILSYTSFTWHLAINLLLSNIFALSPSIWQLPQPASSNRDQSKNKQGKACMEKTFRTLKRISVVMVNPWVMIGSSSGGRPFQQSSSTQRQPASSVWRYISGDEIPENWPAGGQQKERGSTLATHMGQFLHKPEQQNSLPSLSRCMWQTDKMFLVTGWHFFFLHSI